MHNGNTFLGQLDLIKQDCERWLGPTPSNRSGRSSLFGGLVAAQALRAGHLSAGLDRQPHSAHAYFLAPGQFDEPIQCDVLVVRNGRSHSVRHIHVSQSKVPILTMLASYQVPQEGHDYQIRQFNPVSPLREMERLDSGSVTGMTDPGPFELVDADPGPDQPGALEWSAMRYWARTRESLPRDPGVHACAVLAMGDLRTGSPPRAALAAARHVRMASLDYSMWFRSAVVADRWMLFDLRPGGNGGGRGLTQGIVHAENGQVASFATELKFRRADHRSRQTSTPAGLCDH